MKYGFITVKNAVQKELVDKAIREINYYIGKGLNNN